MKVHPSILQLGTQYRSGIISGANVRCLALLNALRTVSNVIKIETERFLFELKNF